MTCRDCERDRPHRGRGLCGSCYNRRWKTQRWDGAPPTRLKPPGPEPLPEEHGTLRGWSQHVRRKTPICEACRTVRREFTQAWRDENRDRVRTWDRRWRQRQRRRAKEGTVKASDRVLDLLEIEGGWWTPAEVAMRTGSNPTATKRLMERMTDRGLVAHRIVELASGDRRAEYRIG